MWEIFQISVIDFEINSVVAREYALYDFNPFTFTDTCFMAWNTVYLGGYSRFS